MGQTKPGDVDHIGVAIDAQVEYLDALVQYRDEKREWDVGCLNAVPFSDTLSGLRWEKTLAAARKALRAAMEKAIRHEAQVMMASASMARKLNALNRTH